MRKVSLRQYVRNLTLRWSIAAAAFTLGLSFAVFICVKFADAKRTAKTFANSAIAAQRTNLVTAGDVLSVELDLKKSFQFSKDERLLFLNEAKKPIVANLKGEPLISCTDPEGICRDWFGQKIVLYQPIYFDEEQKNIWGYLYIEKKPTVDWWLISFVTIVLILGLTIQGLGLCLNFVSVISRVSFVLSDWAKKLSIDPKNSAVFENAPYEELEPIKMSISGLNGEIERLETLAREQGALVTLQGIGHDILNPVSRLKKIASTLRRGHSQLSDEEFLDALDSNIKRLSGYAEQLKFIYKLKIGEEILNQAPVTDVGLEAKGLVKDYMFDPEVIERKVKVIAQVEEGCFVKIPAPALGRILENLCVNAIQSSTKNHSRVRVMVRKENLRVLISVEDQGHGIPENIRSKIFDPAFTTRVNRGTGLGLFVVKQICEQYNAKIRFESNEHGTKFNIEFPIQEVKHDLQIALSR